MSNKRTKHYTINKNKKGIFLVFLYLAAVLLLAVIIYVVPSMLGIFENTYIAKHGEINVTINADAYIIREENVYVSARATDVSRLAKEQELVRGSTKIVELSGKGKELKKDEKSKYADIVKSLGETKITTESGMSEQSGYVCYSVDGAEGKLTYAALKNLRKAEIEDIASVMPTDTVKDKSAASEPLFKIVDNGTWWMVIYVDDKYADRFVAGNSVQVTSNDETIRAFVDSVQKGTKEEKGTIRVVLECNTFMKDYLFNRKIEAEVITESAEGLLIKNSSIVKKDGKKGVLTINKMGEHVFEPINILANDGSQSCVSEGYYMDDSGNLVKTVSTYDEVATKPSKKTIKEAS